MNLKNNKRVIEKELNAQSLDLNLIVRESYRVIILTLVPKWKN